MIKSPLHALSGLPLLYWNQINALKRQGYVNYGKVWLPPWSREIHSAWDTKMSKFLTPKRKESLRENRFSKFFQRSNSAIEPVNGQPDWVCWAVSFISVSCMREWMSECVKSFCGFKLRKLLGENKLKIGRWRFRENFSNFGRKIVARGNRVR